MSQNKCCYCETDISEESKYMEVEHFQCKSAHPYSVIEWNNLLPCCKRCNIEKGSYDVLTDGMIINPADMEPKDHIVLREKYRFRQRDEIGSNTIEELYLNDSKRLVIVRFKIGEAINISIELIHRDMDCLIIVPNSRKFQKRVMRALRSLLEEAAPSTPFSATAATCILRNEKYDYVKDELAKLGLWSAEIAQDHSVAVSAILFQR